MLAVAKPGDTSRRIASRTREKGHPTINAARLKLIVPNRQACSSQHPLNRLRSTFSFYLQTDG
ncbi:uncharacterized protein MYCFIDRAFT_175678 [Pseudocercospora fijiensis CIRAD86]|uniref:Uncharacterized protein n=1 Tax=Pseudocercospora fijiensis (strain CIRAD86) TaxID=383855 RepID=M2YWN4_PSEFD|nr:uncharacterized protein MYCFIDRAFT_175678 [Pseudocercospora fijiensis CIRAD86]EME82135.1 hypothetical protein MYCFIDRAFT_175678 [Pseudocercospora fijiensis CIRAD86]